MRAPNFLMDIAVTGSSGLIGTALVAELTAAGHDVRRLVRRATSSPGEVRWDPDAGTIDAAGLEGIDAAVNLAGEPIGERRWNDAQKRRIRESRTRGTHLLAETMANLSPHPAVLLSGSAVGFYGDGGDAVLTEESTKGEGFLPELVVDWEAAAAPAAEAGIRTVFLRTGIVLTPTGGAMRKTLPLFKLGLGGPIGDGSQWWPWISLADEVGAIVGLLAGDVSGPVNLTAPQPVTNAVYTKALGRALHRPAIVRVPRFGPRLLLGSELADALLGDSQRVVPERLVASGYVFRHPDIDTALASMFAR